MAYIPRLDSVGIPNNPKWYSRNPFYQTDPDLGLPNCTCYAWGRFWEISDPNNAYINRPNLSLGNAKEWWNYTQDGYERGQTPKLGATICFAPAAGSTRVGHVGVVEQIGANGVIVTSNSDYGGRYFYTETLTPDSYGKYHHDVYTSQGFIYNPYAEQPTPPTPTEKRGKFPWVIYARKLRSV